MPSWREGRLFDRIGEILTAYRMMTAEAAVWKTWDYPERN